jgi:hypothetical protein
VRTTPHPPVCACSHHRTPQELASQVAKALPAAVAASNVGVMREHLERHTYVSGTADAPRTSYRDYRRRRNGRWQAPRVAGS